MFIHNVFPFHSWVINLSRKNLAVTYSANHKNEVNKRYQVQFLEMFIHN